MALLLKELGMGDEDDSMNDAIAEMEIEASDTDGECLIECQYESVVFGTNGVVSVFMLVMG